MKGGILGKTVVDLNLQSVFTLCKIQSERIKTRVSTIMICQEDTIQINFCAETDSAQCDAQVP